MDYRKALDVIKARWSADLNYLRALEAAGEVLAAAAVAETNIADLKAAREKAQDEYAARQAELERLASEATQLEDAAEDRIRRAEAAVAAAELAKDKAIADAQALAAEVRTVLAAENDALKAKFAVELAALGKEVAALRDERDALLRAIAELKRLAAR